jgi:hypothetical protein
MLLSGKMITGFNTDVQHEGRIYHVQTEDRGSRENPVLESLVYVGGTVVAKKRTPYGERVREGASEETIASLLKKQHQVIIAAIKAGRIEDLIRHSAKESGNGRAPVPPLPAAPVVATAERPGVGVISHASLGGAVPPPAASKPLAPIPAVPIPAASNTAAPDPIEPRRPSLPAGAKPATPPPAPAKGATGGLNLDEVISDYIKRSSEQGRLDLKVIAPSLFIAGRSVALRVQVSQGAKPEPEAVVTVKIIGTAFKPQVFIGRGGPDGIATFSLALPAFTAGTAAIVIEAQSKKGRGELKHLIRRA